MWYLDREAGTVARFRIASARTAVSEIDENLNSLADDVVRAIAIHVDDEANSASVVFRARIVQRKIVYGGRAGH